ncbi:MAG: peroxiredoxin, partial [Thiomicrorhabdus sp.]|nr:peroxiredoxin [Thiomicrorhabdus sp.]
AWQPGDKVIVPPAATVEEAKARMSSDEFECVDFYFCKKSI